MNEKKNDCLPCPCGTHSKAACDLAGTCGQRTAATCSAVPNMPELVNRFLGWPLPNAASRRLAPDIDRPIGTHLLDAGEARAMLEYVLATPASSAPGGEAAIGYASKDILEKIKASGVKSAMVEVHREAGPGHTAAIYAHPAAAPDSAQQGEDEPPLPEPTHTYEAHMGARIPAFSADQIRQYARTYHAHMMRKLGDGAGSITADDFDFSALLGRIVEVSKANRDDLYDKARADLLSFMNAKLAQARAAGDKYKAWYDAVTDACIVSGGLPWDETDAKGSLARLIAWNVEIALDPRVSERAARLIAAGAERAVPEGWEQAAAFIEKKAQDYINEHAETEPDTGAVAFNYGEAGRDYHSSLVELAEELRAAAPSPAAAKEGEKAGCSKCGCAGLHACPGYPIPAWTPEKVEELNRVLDELEADHAQQDSAQVAGKDGGAK